MEEAIQLCCINSSKVEVLFKMTKNYTSKSKHVIWTVVDFKFGNANKRDCTQC
jgi:hypothetical protein